MTKSYPGILGEIAELAGDDAADAIAAAFGGRRVYFPSLSRLKPHSPLARVVGLDTARAIVSELCAAKTGLEFDMPVGSNSPVTTVLTALAARVRGGILEGLTTGEVAQRCGCTRRTVQIHRRSMIQAGTMPAGPPPRSKVAAPRGGGAAPSRTELETGGTS